jgi:hypothetical protein
MFKSSETGFDLSPLSVYGEGSGVGFHYFCS